METLQRMTELLLDWYPGHARDLPWRKDQDPYHVWISEIMLQQTRVEAVKDYYRRFLTDLPDIQALANVDEEHLLKLWEGLGYYNRARNLQKAAVQIEEQYSGSFPQTYDEILGLTGIGEYTAGAIGSICFELETPAVDGNVLRVYTRVLEDSSNIDKASTKKMVRQKLLPHYHSGSCGTLNQSLMELGATVCIPNGCPKCEICPLKDICGASTHGTFQQFPVRDVKKGRKEEKRTVFILLSDDQIVFRKRENKGLLAGLWELPNVEGHLTEQQASDLVTDWGYEPKHLLKMQTYTHIFSHVEWNMQAYFFVCNKRITEKDIRWVDIKKIETEVAVPSAFKPFLSEYSE